MRLHWRFPAVLTGVLFLLLQAPYLRAGETLPAAERGRIDAAVREVLADSGAPGASIAVVKDGAIAYVEAYGLARLDPPVPAKPAMRYSIGSISKQFTAAAVLMLVEEGRLSLDDRLVRWFPQLSGADRVTIRQLLSMTSGYQDFWPQDYVMPMMLEPVKPGAILERWGKKPLDFEPGTKWQYSNTNYVIAGLIVEKTTGMPLTALLRERVFEPLHMASVVDSDEAPLGPAEPAGTVRVALGPLRPAPAAGAGWMFAAGELAMTAEDLARWDLSMIDRTVLKPSSYSAMQTEVLLADGLGTRYGLGVGVASENGHRVIAHGGEVSGFTARNAVYPDDRAAVVVMTNLDATSASQRIAEKIAGILFTASDPATEAALAQAKAVFAGLQQGRIDRTLLTADANAYFTTQALADCAASLGPLGTPETFVQQSTGRRGGMTVRRYRVRYAAKTLRITTYTTAEGGLEQFIVAAAE